MSRKKLSRARGVRSPRTSGRVKGRKLVWHQGYRWRFQLREGVAPDPLDLMINPRRKLPLERLR